MRRRRFPLLFLGFLRRRRLFRPLLRFPPFELDLRRFLRLLLFFFPFPPARFTSSSAPSSYRSADGSFTVFSLGAAVSIESDRAYDIAFPMFANFSVDTLLGLVIEVLPEDQGFQKLNQPAFSAVAVTKKMANVNRNTFRVPMIPQTVEMNCWFGEVQPQS